MTVQDIISGAWGAGGAMSIAGAFFILFIRRLLSEYDKKHLAFEDKIEGLDTKIEDLHGVITELKIAIATMTSEVNHINKAMDRGEMATKTH